MIIDRRAMLAGGAALATGLSARAATPPPPYPGGDIALLQGAYTAMHPGLLRYNTQAEIDARFGRLARDFDAAGDLPTRYLLLSRFLATIRCGHTYANFYNQSDAVQTALFAGQDRLPFLFRWVGDRMVATGDPGSTGVVRGTEVLSIDGRPAREVLAGLTTLARADGSNDAKRRRLMSVEGLDRYESFDVFYPLLFGRRDRYRLRLRAPDGRERDETLPAIDLMTRRAEAKPLATARDAAVWTLDWRGGTAVLTMPTWGLYDKQMGLEGVACRPFRGDRASRRIGPDRRSARQRGRAGLRR